MLDDPLCEDSPQHIRHHNYGSKKQLPIDDEWLRENTEAYVEKPRHSIGLNDELEQT